MTASEPVRIAAAKRPYQAPRLTVHGTVAELTQAKLVGQQLAPGYLAAG